MPFHLGDLIDEVTDQFREMVLRTGVELIVDLEPQAPLELLGDPMRLRQVFVNLVGNAFKFTPQGQIVLGVGVEEADEDSARLHFRVEDTGIGIEPDKMSELFEAFTQADASTSRRFGGSGLGLSISRRLVQLMGGEGIDVESEKERGSAFSFSLEFGLTDIEKRPDIEAPPDLAGLRILLVEDNPQTSLMLERMLESFGFDSESAISAEKAFEMLSAEDAGRFSLILMDWRLPGMDGFAAAEKIMSDDALHSLPIIMMSAYGRNREAVRARNWVSDRTCTNPSSSHHCSTP